LLGSFASDPFDHDVVLGQVRSLVYLGTGRPGMDGCAVVTTSLVRLTGSAQSTVASGTLETSILPRRQVIDPIVVPMPLVDPLVAAAGDRVIFEVALLTSAAASAASCCSYDSVGRASAVELYAPGDHVDHDHYAGATTSTTTTTLPDVSRDRDRLLRAAGSKRWITSDRRPRWGGPRFSGAFERRIDRSPVRAALIRDPRRVRKAAARSSAPTQLSRGQGNGRVARGRRSAAALAQGAMRI
jgi:hypothetical protein